MASSPPPPTPSSPAAAPPPPPPPPSASDPPPEPPSDQPPPPPQQQQQQEDQDQEQEEAECGFCLFMKGGGCKDAFIAWEQCVEAAEKSGDNIVDKCFEVTSNLKKCMDAHADYYEPILRAEEALADSIAQENTADPKDQQDHNGKTDSSQQDN